MFNDGEEVTVNYKWRWWFYTVSSSSSVLPMSLLCYRRNMYNSFIRRRLYEADDDDDCWLFVTNWVKNELPWKPLPSSSSTTYFSFIFIAGSWERCLCRTYHAMPACLTHFSLSLFLSLRAIRHQLKIRTHVLLIRLVHSFRTHVASRYNYMGSMKPTCSMFMFNWIVIRREREYSETD